MFFRRKREITDLEKTEIIIEYLEDKMEAYSELYWDAGPIEPIKLIETILDYEKRKHHFMTSKSSSK